MLECNVTECCSCGNEFDPPCKGWHWCWDCFINPLPEKKDYEVVVVENRKRAHRDKKDLDRLIELPYLERLAALYRKGHQISYPPQEEEH
jgi:hypothetical protein